MTNYKTVELGKLEELGKNYKNGKAFLHDALGLTSCEISVNAMPKSTKLPFNHKHKQNEEIYIFLKGEGTLTLDGNAVEFKEGTCVRVAPAVSRTLEAKTDVQYICVQAKENALEQFGFGDGEICK